MIADLVTPRWAAFHPLDFCCRAIIATCYCRQLHHRCSRIEFGFVAFSSCCCFGRPDHTNIDAAPSPKPSSAVPTFVPTSFGILCDILASHSLTDYSSPNCVGLLETVPPWTQSPSVSPFFSALNIVARNVGHGAEQSYSDKTLKQRDALSILCSLLMRRCLWQITSMNVDGHNRNTFIGLVFWFKPFCF